MRANFKARSHEFQLKGFQKAFFNAEGNCFFAFTLLPVEAPGYEDLYNWFLYNKACSYKTAGDERRYNNYNAGGSYGIKGKEQLVKEGIMKFVSLHFFGIKYNDEWFVVDELAYHEASEALRIEAETEARCFNQGTFSRTAYRPVPARSAQPDFGKLRQSALEKAGVSVGLQDYDLIFSHAKGLPKEEVPYRQVAQPVEWREFIGQPWLVGYVKQERKSKINRAFETYTNEAVFLPFVQELKIQRPEEFAAVYGLYSEHYPLLYPHSKEYILGVVKAKNEKGQSRLHYFLYLPLPKQLFRWTKPEVKEAGGHHAYWIPENTKDLSTRGDEFFFHEPSVTMDDPDFWQETYSKRKTGRFFTRPLSIEAKQPVPVKGCLRSHSLRPFLAVSLLKFSALKSIPQPPGK